MQAVPMAMLLWPQDQSMLLGVTEQEAKQLWLPALSNSNWQPFHLDEGRSKLYVEGQHCDSTFY